MKAIVKIEVKRVNLVLISYDDIDWLSKEVNNQEILEKEFNAYQYVDTICHRGEIRKKCKVSKLKDDDRIIIGGNVYLILHRL